TGAARTAWYREPEEGHPADVAAYLAFDFGFVVCPFGARPFRKPRVEEFRRMSMSSDERCTDVETENGASVVAAAGVAAADMLPARAHARASPRRIVEKVTLYGATG